MKQRPLFWFYIFVTYIALQFVWWVVLFFRLLDSANLSPEESSSKMWMLFGEGSVFILILILGFFQVRRTFKKESALNHMQRNFLLAVGHELKTPLASAKLRLQTLGKHNLDEEKKDKLVTTAHEDVSRLNNLVDKILMATSIEKKSIVIYNDSFLIDEMLNQRVAFWNDYYENRIKLENEIQENKINTDQTALTSILDNLIENAAKYSDDEVVVKTKTISENLYLTVADQGKGIPKNYRQAVYNMFFRISDESKREVKGSGLGLYIVKHLVTSMNGNIDMESSNQGTTISVKIPLAPLKE